MFEELKDYELCECLCWLNKDDNKNKLKIIFKEALEELKKRVPLLAKSYEL